MRRRALEFRTRRADSLFRRGHPARAASCQAARADSCTGTKALIGPARSLGSLDQHAVHAPIAGLHGLYAYPAPLRRLAQLGARNRQIKAECRPLPFALDQTNLTLVQFEHPMHDQQAEAAATACLRAAEWTSEQAVQQLGRDTGSTVADGHRNLAVLVSDLDLDHTALGGITQRVVEQIGQHALDHAEIGDHGRQLPRKIRREPYTACLGREFEFLEHVLHEVRQRKRLEARLHETVLETRKFKECLCKSADLTALVERDRQITTP